MWLRVLRLCFPTRSENLTRNEIMQVRLPELWIDRMVAQPESGMGYQRVDVQLATGRIVPGHVFNSEILETSELVRLAEITAITVK